MDDSDQYACILEFDSDSTEFARGFEAGMLWGRMIHEGGIAQMIHASNAEMVIRMAEAYGRVFAGEPVGEDWVRVTVGVVPEDPAD